MKEKNIMTPHLLERCVNQSLMNWHNNKGVNHNDWC